MEEKLGACGFGALLGPFGGFFGGFWVGLMVFGCWAAGLEPFWVRFFLSVLLWGYSKVSVLVVLVLAYLLGSFGWFWVISVGLLCFGVFCFCLCLRFWCAVWCVFFLSRKKRKNTKKT